MGGSIIVVDSVEKTAGTSIKHLLRRNFAANSFFDYDNGDPPGVALMNYGIQCDAGGTPPSDEYRDNRGRWLAAHLDDYDLQCVYGHGLWQGAQPIDELLSASGKDLRLVTFLRDPIRRIMSEYHYVLRHAGHPLHQPAVRAGDVLEWFRSPERPKNRQTQGLLGKRASLDVDAAIQRLKRHTFVGIVEQMTESLYLMCKTLRLKRILVPHLNSTKKPRFSPEFYLKAGRVFRSFDAADHQLYEWAAGRFEQTLADLQPPDAEGIAALKWLTGDEARTVVNRANTCEWIPLEQSEAIKTYSELLEKLRAGLEVGPALPDYIDRSGRVDGGSLRFGAASL